MVTFSKMYIFNEPNVVHISDVIFPFEQCLFHNDSLRESGSFLVLI